MDGNGELSICGVPMFASMNAEKFYKACCNAGLPGEVLAQIERHKDVIVAAYLALETPQEAAEEPTKSGGK